MIFLSSILLSGMYSSNQVFAQENVAEIEAEIEQENKCIINTECKNENELNNQLGITNITKQAQTTEEPNDSSLTVKKQIFGCDDISGDGGIEEIMQCQSVENDSPSWLSCNGPTIGGSLSCQNLQDMFDIEVLD